MSEHITSDGEVMEIHPLADLFPMLPDDELAELADDIKENGLRQPIVLDHDRRVVDGRNRLKACALAGVEPQFQQLNGEDIAAFIVSQNINRRHLTKAQRAMSVAMIYPEAPRGRGNVDPAVKGEENASFSYRRLQQARTVLRFGKEDLAPAVMAGTTPLDVAYTATCKRRDAVDSEETQLAELRWEAPDLADMVEEERLSLDEARIIFKKRKDDEEAAEKNKRETLIRVTENAYRSASAWAAPQFEEELRSRLSDARFRNELLTRLRIEGRPDDVRAGAAADRRQPPWAIGRRQSCG